VNPDDGVRIVHLYNQSLNRSRTLKDWQWEFLDGPGRELFGWVAEVNDRLAAHWAVIPLHLHVEGRTLLSGKGELAVTDPAYRGHALCERPSTISGGVLCR
jgi:hypothetical protein